MVLGSYNDIAGHRPNPTIGGTILGGTNNIVGGLSVHGHWSTIVGEHDNFITGTGSTALGINNTNVSNNGCLVWNDNSVGPQVSAVDNTVILNTANGVGINTNNPQGNALFANGTVRATGFIGSGATGASMSIGIQTNIVGPHGYTLCFTNGLFINAAPY
jgi:hypothetical protein